MIPTRRALLSMTTLSLLGLSLAAQPAAASAAEIDGAANKALQKLYATHPQSRELGKRAVAILVFPKILKAGFVVGAQTGDGALFVGGKPVGHYNISAASYGLQAGVQSFSYALFFMNDASLKYLRDSGGWSVGAGPSFVVVDQGMAKNFDTTTLTQDVYAFPFGQQGLMAGIGLQGSKITLINP